MSFGRYGLHIDPGDPLLVHLAGHVTDVTDAVGSGDEPGRDAAALGEVVVVRSRPAALDVGPSSSRRAAVELHPTVHPDHRLLNVRRQPTDP
jgi:hypothetical protein